jgi:hypothetical protein
VWHGLSARAGTGGRLDQLRRRCSMPLSFEYLIYLLIGFIYLFTTGRVPFGV